MTVRIRFDRPKWAYRAIDYVRKHGGVFDPETKLWTVPADFSADGYGNIASEIEVVS